MERDTLEFRGEIRYEPGEPPSFRFVVDSTRMPIGFARVDPLPLGNFDYKSRRERGRGTARGEFAKGSHV